MPFICRTVPRSASTKPGMDEVAVGKVVAREEAVAEPAAAAMAAASAEEAVGRQNNRV